MQPAMWSTRSVEVLLDTPPGSPKNCPEARGGSVRVQISLSRPVSFFMVKPSCLSAKNTVSYDQLIADLFSCMFPLLGSWIMAGGRLANAECLDDIAKSWIIRYSGISLYGRGVNFVTLTGSSLTRHVALPDHGVGLDGQSCSCLIVGWPVDLSSPILGVGHPSVMFLFDCWPVGRPMPRMVRGCYRRPAHAKPKEPAIDKPMLMPTEASNVSPSGLVPSIEN
ncbi:hypothetical protein F2Q68_00004513 [Brassica cretica]|uniref:Uncharacterized protein n=1 Tax=Brassica cretica TaxID=69181 RepID=A0A8S9JB95_BRACR|nr:hypothetical protein F2Q68_00004513 [Brassica cretica]